MKSTSKTQRSITSFFGGAVVSTPPKRKTREEHDEEKRAEASSKKVKVAKKKKKRAPKENKKTKKEEEQEQVEEGKEAHVETHEFIEEEKEDEPGVKKEDQNIQVLASEEEQENDDDTPVSVKSTAKLTVDSIEAKYDSFNLLFMCEAVRRRLRQRIVETDDDESDMEFLMNTKVLDVSSPLSNPENEGEKTEMVDTTRKEGEDEKHRETSVIDTEKKTRKTKSKIETATSKTNDFFLPVANTSATQSVVTVDQKALPSNATAETLDDLPGTLNTQAQDTSYVALANLFAKIEEVSSRLAIQDLLTAFFRDVIRYSPEDLLACTYLCVCVDLAPPFENLKIGIGDAILMKAIGEATGANLKFIKEMYHKEGDLGKVAQNARSKQKTLSFTSLSPASSNGSGLSVKHVYNQFVKIAKMTGNNSQQQKCSIIKGLLVKCEKEKKFQEKDAESAGAAKYIIRGLQGKLRIGLAEKSILMGLTYAFMTEKEYKDKNKQQEALVFVKKAFAECPSYNALIAAFYEVQKDVRSGPFLCVKDFALVASKCVLTPGTPVSPMLARPTKAYAAVFDRFEGKPFTCEYKYDGERAQIHILPNGEIAVFSRNFENSTERFPDVKMAIADAAKKGAVQSCIVDAEVVAVDRATNKRLPFQILSTRSRKVHYVL
ncbi:hypothetical protein PsorP6_013976 [Peronosclerospora sorghi]|uniref:Uncharacterized protein n=1 Tax=Peronosclerospora sorghi TaxID=230839 RepID=A0ACC0VJ33_9STRA|nr:hypothetical protein PsorP6_013976 [Peronosclerospora sorghi]